MDVPPVFPLFDSPQFLEEGNAAVNQHIAWLTLNRVPDAAFIYEHTMEWLLESRHSENNYKTYRSELTTFLHWCLEVEQVSPVDVSRRTMNRYVDYCLAPPRALIAYRNVAQFVVDKELGERRPNPLWRPFLGKKSDGTEQPYRLSDKALKTKMAVLSSFYAYLINEEVTERNPATMWMRHSRFGAPVAVSANLFEEDEVRVFTDLQWSYVMNTAHTLAESNPERHERTLFLVSLMYGCYLRISEVAARPGFSPVMGQFRRDPKTGIWSFYIPVSKGGKKRTVAVSRELLEALQRYRTHLGLSLLPAPGEVTPLFVRHRAAGRGRDQGLLNANLGIRQLRELLNELLAAAADAAMTDGFDQDASEMRTLTVHGIRHTGITHDINYNGRPLSHVQADAGHDSIDTTSQYLHTGKTERHESAANKRLDRLRDG
ncbi:tyrosine-type recombinase/integrase [Oceanimonas baumannii]|uniref:Integrase n=1 Tax=Oceanimonas baumannii TaxID=129578 RepID=A0A235C9C9_9GAMM|nr:site-specific integrase [Oceanimonas baumannii]OYD21241.1 integrase [Oceanimonas baumannii]TDW55264.1 site-specific recombinase XerD [Oceanimonas baumannii]